MAVLEKIRKRSVLLFIIIIGALLAFILGDFLNSGRSLFGPGDTVAQVGNVKVKQNELAERSKSFDENVKSQIASMQAQGRQVPAEYADNDFKHDQAFQSLLFEKLLNEEYDRMGIEVPDELLQELIYSPAFAENVYGSLFGDQQTYQQFAAMGIADPNSFRDAIDNPKRYNLDDQTAQILAERWKEMETNLDKNVRATLYGQMLSGLFQPNKADAKVDFDNTNTQTTVEMVSVPLSTIADADVKIADSDYQAVYDKLKGAYKINDETREIAYIVVPIQASQKDYQDVTAEVATLKAELTTTEGLSAVAKHKNFSSSTYKLTNSQLPYSLKADSVGPTVGSVHQVAPYSLAKILSTSTGIDNVVFDFMPAESVAQLDSLLGGKDMAAVDSIIRVTTQGQTSDLKTSLINPNQNVAPLLANTKLNKAVTEGALNELIAIADTVNGQPVAFGIVVKERSNPEAVYEVAEVSTQVYPSSATRQELTQKLHNYVAKNGSADAFAKGTDYHIEYALINPSSYTLANSNTTPGTRSLVKWAMDADKGSVSPVYTKQKTMIAVNPEMADVNEEYLIAVAVIDIYDDEYVPVTSNIVKNELEPMVRADKKAEMISGKYKASDFNGYAKAMGATPQTMPVTFGANSFGRQAQGALAGAKKGSLVGPVKGTNAVYVFNVKDVTTGDFDKADAKTRINETRSFRPVNYQNIELFIGNRKLKNNMLIFTADETQD